MSQFTGIREFRAEALGVDPGTEFALDIFDLDDNEMAAAKFLFQRLEKLVLNMALWVPDEDLFGEIVDKFTTLLQTSTDLQSLHLHPTRGESEIDARSLFAHLVLQTTWPKLTILSLKGVFADEQDFSGMIKRHKATLTNVNLSKCSLLKGAWADVVDDVVYGTKIFPFVLDCVNEEALPTLDYSSLSTSEREHWEYEGRIEVAKDGDRYFVSTDPTPSTGSANKTRSKQTLRRSQCTIVGNNSQTTQGIFKLPKSLRSLNKGLVYGVACVVWLAFHSST